MAHETITQAELASLRGETARYISELEDRTDAPWDAQRREFQTNSFLADRITAIRRVRDGALNPPSMVFVCVHNAGRSQMAAGWARFLAGDQALVFSGGSNPGAVVNPMAIQAMAEVGIDISREFPTPITDDIVEASDVVVTMGCGDECPYFPGKQYVDWDLADPHDQEIEMVRVVRDDIEQRVRRLLSDLGVDQLA